MCAIELEHTIYIPRLDSKTLATIYIQFLSAAGLGNLVHVSCCSAQAAHKLVLTSSAKQTTDAKDLTVLIDTYTVLCAIELEIEL